jgi:hypothetical protein
MRPTDIGHGHPISGDFRRWRREGRRARVMATLPQWERQSHGSLPVPSACCAESHRLKAATPGTDMGFDGPKQGKGRQRPLLGDTLGLLVAVMVSAADTDEHQGLVAL